MSCKATKYNVGKCDWETLDGECNFRGGDCPYSCDETEENQCDCESKFKLAEHMHFTHKALKTLTTMKRTFKPLPFNEFKCINCGKVYKKNW